jgi:hypothetical protein
MNAKMNFTPCRYLNRMPRTLDVSQLEKSGEPAHQVISKLIHNCSPDEATCTAVTTAFVLSLWQLRGDTLSQHVPSSILLNAGNMAPDPVDDFIAAFTREGTDKGARQTKDRRGIHIDPEKATDIMASTAYKRRELGPASKHDYLDERSAQALEERYHDAKSVAFGRGPARGYSKAWSDDFGFITDENDVLIARLNEAPDRAVFQRDVIEDPNKLHNPVGIGRGLLTVRKAVAVSGSLSEDLWDEELVMGIIKLGLPILFVPHTGKELLAVSNTRALDAFPCLWRNADVSRAHTSLDLLPIDWFEAHSNDIRQRLHLLPGSGTYGFAVLQVLRQLFGVCNQIAKQAGSNHEAKPEHVGGLFWDLYTRTFRGITLGVAALAWHGFGFDPGCPREKAVKVLHGLRTRGPMTRNEILRSYHLGGKEQRDILLERLASEDLVRIDHKTVTAASFEEFVCALHSRPELPGAASFRKAADGENQA